MDAIAPNGFDKGSAKAKRPVHSLPKDLIGVAVKPILVKCLG
jgi:hypothetical protein